MASEGEIIEFRRIVRNWLSAEANSSTMTIGGETGRRHAEGIALDQKDKVIAFLSQVGFADELCDHALAGVRIQNAERT